MTALAFLLARLLIGLGIFAHGAQKAFGWFGGRGLDATGAHFGTLGFRPGVLFAGLAAFGETVGGLLTALGLAGPVGPAFIILVMIVASGSVHLPNGYFAAKNGVELHGAYIAGALLLAYAGPGPWSLDAAFGLSEAFTETVITVALVIAIAIALLHLAFRRPQPAS